MSSDYRDVQKAISSIVGSFLISVAFAPPPFNRNARPVSIRFQLNDLVCINIFLLNDQCTCKVVQSYSRLFVIQARTISCFTKRYYDRQRYMTWQFLASQVGARSFPLKSAQFQSFILHYDTSVSAGPSRRHVNLFVQKQRASRALCFPFI